MKKQITEQEFLILVGLMHIARTHNKKMNEYWEAINELIEDDDDTIGWYVLEEHPFDKKFLSSKGIEVVE